MNVPVTSDFERMLRRASLRVTGPRVAVLAAVYDHPHADTDSITGVVRAHLGVVSDQAVYDVLPPWQPRMIEIRGTAAVVAEGGRALNERFEDTIVRIQPTRIISFGIDSGESANARSVGAA